MTVLKNDIFERYLHHLIKKNLLRDMIILTISITYLLINLPSVVRPYLINDDLKFCGLFLLTDILLYISFSMPVLTFYAFNNKKRLDVIYSLPLDRKKVALANLLGGGFSLFCIYTVSYIVYFCYILLYSSYFSIGYILLYYPISLLYCFVIYSFFSFIFTKANTTFDGVVFCLTWSVIIVAVLFALSIMIYSFTGFDDFSDEFFFSGSIISPIYSANDVFADLIEYREITDDLYGSAFRLSHFFVVYTAYPIWTVIGVLCLFGFLKTFPQKAAYKAEDISNSIFGYKFLVPITGFTLMYILNGLGTVVVSAILYIGMVIGYAIYRRGFRFKKSDIIILVIGLLLLLKWVFFGSLSFNQY